MNNAKKINTEINCRVFKFFLQKKDLTNNWQGMGNK